MTPAIPCIRHGVASTADPRLLELLAHAARIGLTAPTGKLEALLDYEGQLWATWRGPAALSAGAPLLTRAWTDVGGERGALHLIRSDEDYDYQEDCMNDASA